MFEIAEGRLPSIATPEGLEFWLDEIVHAVKNAHIGDECAGWTFLSDWRLLGCDEQERPSAIRGKNLQTSI